MSSCSGTRRETPEIGDPMKRYEKGKRAEKKSRAWLEARGYFVIEARGSHGPCDLIAIDGERVRVVQVKSGRRPSKADIFEIVAAMQKVPNGLHITKEIHHWPDYAREPNVETVEDIHHW